MVFAAELARLAGRLDDDLVDRHRGDPHVASGCRSTYRGDRWPRLLRRDEAGQEDPRALLRFVVLDGLARPNRLEGPTPRCCRPPTPRSPATEGTPRLSAADPPGALRPCFRQQCRRSGAGALRRRRGACGP